MDKKNSHFSFSLLSLDFLLLNISFFAINFLKKGTLKLSPMYMKLLIAFYIIWLFVSLFVKKFHLPIYKSYWTEVILLAKSTVFNAYCVSFMVVIMGLIAYSRIHIFGTFTLLFALEFAIFSIYYLSKPKEEIVQTKGFDVEAQGKPEFSIFLLLSDLLLVSLSFFIVNFYKRGTFELYPEYEKLLLVIYGLWFLTSFMTNKFDRRNFQNYYYAIAPCAKAVILVIAIMSILIFAFRLFYFSRIQIFGSLLMFSIFESALYYSYFIFSLKRENNRDIESIEGVKTLIKQKELTLEIDIEDIRSRLTKPIKEDLQAKCLKGYPWLFDFVDQSLDLSEFIRAETAIMDSADMFHLNLIDDHPIRLFINLHRLNDVRWLNRYFLEIQRTLVNGGYFIGRIDTIATHKKHFFGKYPKYFAEVFYIMSFIYRRIFPKIPGIKKVYFAVTKGKNRMISRAEVLGRLHFCGLKVIAEKEMENSLYCITQKARTPSPDQNPSYGPLVRLERIGANGRPICIYKFRTMHPYSEYLQEHIYEKNKLQNGGKIKDDFRISTWGRFMRRIWLDELPTVYNWIKGELRLFGVRPLSLHYLSLYSEDLQEMRKKVKPGLIPPFYADLPETFSEICESEKRYIQAYLREPLKTQWVYFWKTFYNIIIKGARSN